MSEFEQRSEARHWMYAVALVAAAVGAAWAATRWILPPGAPLRGEVARAALTIVAGGFIGGVLKILLDDVVAARRRWDDAATFVANVLADLKAVYDRVERARLLLPAHQSAQTYGDELRDLIEERVRLLNVERALRRRSDGLAQPVREALEADVARMERFIGHLTTEFRDRYREIANAQEAYEAAKKLRLDQVDPQAPAFPALRNEPWERILGLPRARAFLDPEPADYRREFVRPLDHASVVLRAELARILRRRRPSAHSLEAADEMLPPPFDAAAAVAPPAHAGYDAGASAAARGRPTTP
jgi:hypothetical protein